ncbi:hypothetical protein [Saccharopolyspora spinosa]|uniref:Uncharacterized protein n=2 Tax=Saccharopolyspora spinosa TaxID=60894 RepID=A0A2N3Y1L4_SACSN|nr:hypothetical protein [Saccharopolyspora spinosa]PKW16792.1 hypothetical protein A8926_4677 [Saccharopolyspora spinosa]
MDIAQFLLAAARYRLDMADADEVIAAASSLTGTPAVPDEALAISALTPVDTRREELQPLVDQVLTGLGAQPLDDRTAAATVARSVAAAIRTDQVEPYDGARQLWRLARKVPAAEPSLTGFIHLASEWEDVPDQRAEIEADIKTEAGKLEQP